MSLSTPDRKPKKRYKLVDFVMTKVDRVKAGDNPEARLVMTKAKPKVVKVQDPDSLDGRLNEIRRSWEAQNPSPQGGPYSYVDSIYDDRIIVCRGDDYYQASYSDNDGEFTFGPLQEVEVSFSFTPKSAGYEFPATPSTIPDNTPQEVDVSDLNKDALPEDVRKHLDDLESQLAASQEQVEAKTAEVAAVSEELEKAKAGEPAPDPVEKAVAELPEAVRDQIAKEREERDALAERVAKMESDAKRAAFVAKAREDFANLPETPEVIGDALMQAEASLDADAYQAIERTLKAANAQIDATKVFGEFGTATAAEADASARWETAAKAYMAENPGVTLAVAKDRVLDIDPALGEDIAKARQ